MQANHHQMLGSCSYTELTHEAISVIEAEATALKALTNKIDHNFQQCLKMIFECTGRIVITGLGKSGIVGQKISATLASTGTPSLFLHASEAAHGDLGRITPQDVVMALSNSGESDELMRLVQPIKAMGAPLIALTGEPHSSLAKHADLVLSIGRLAEACPMGLVPTVSTSAMMAMGDALAMALFKARGFGPEEYARYHPGGALGRKLMKVHEVMRKGPKNPTLSAQATLREAIQVMTQTPGRPGAVSLCNNQGQLIGFFTDGDLRRLLGQEAVDLNMQMLRFAQKMPTYTNSDEYVTRAAQILREREFDQLPVIDENQMPIGLLDIQDIFKTKDFT